jgi:protein-tyrosine kinase
MSDARAAQSVEGASRSSVPFEITPSIVMLSDPNGLTAESIRALRTRLQAGHLQAGHRSLAVCGPSFSVGSTFISVNLAVAMSQIGIKTLLIDGDLREPSVQTYFTLPEPSKGLYECLQTGGNSGDYIHHDVLPDLDILFAGQPSEAGQELLAGGNFADLSNVTMRDYEMTIVDTPPANSCADGRRISTLFGFSLLVARKNRTLVADVRTLRKQLMAEHAVVVGTVLNSF